MMPGRLFLSIRKLPLGNFVCPKVVRLFSSPTPATPSKQEETTKSEVAASENYEKSTVSGKPEKISRKKRFSKTTELLNYIHSQIPGAKCPSEVFPKKFVRVHKSIAEFSYLVDNEVANSIAKVLKRQGLNKKIPVIEINPGPGMLTAKLKQDLKFKNVTCFEEDANMREKLSSLGANVVPGDYMALPRLHHADKIDGGNRVGNLLEQIHTGPIMNETEDLYVFGVIPHVSFINFTIKSLVTQRILYEDEFGWQNPIYFLCLGAKAYWILTANTKSGLYSYRPSSILFQIFFKCEAIQTLPRKAFIPWETPPERCSAKYRERNKYNAESMHLVRIETRKETLDTLGKDHLLPFWFFVRHHLFSRKRQIIAELEQWIPGCGPKLIRQGFTIYTQFGELNPEQILDVYMQFISWPEFQSCSFLSAVEKYLTHIDADDRDEV